MTKQTHKTDQTILKIEHLKKWFGDLEVLKDINLEVKRGEVVVIIGAREVERAHYYVA